MRSPKLGVILIGAGLLWLNGGIIIGGYLWQVKASNPGMLLPVTAVVGLALVGWGIAVLGRAAKR